MRSLSKRPAFLCAWLGIAIIGLIAIGASTQGFASVCGLAACLCAFVMSDKSASSALRNAGIGVWRRDDQSAVFEFNTIGQEILGLSGGAIGVEALLACVSADDRRDLIDALNAATYRGSNIDVVFSVKVEGNIRAIRLRGGKGDGPSDELTGTVEDATEDARRTDSIVERHSLYERIAENVPGVVYQMIRFPDGSRQVPFISQRVEDLYGVTREQVYAKANLLIDAIHPDEREEKEALAQESMTHLTKFDWTGRIVRPDGEERWIHALCEPARLPNGAILWDGVMLDVTELKRAELEHMQTKDRLAWLLRSSPVVIYSCEARAPFPITYLSDNSDELLCIPVNECLSDPQYWQGRIHPEESEAALRALEDVCRDGQAVIEYRIRIPSGDYRWVRDEMRFLKEAGAIVGTVVDVTERRRAQEAQRLSDERFLAMSNSSPLGVFLTDAQGECLYANAMLEEITGQKSDELGARALLSLVHVDDAERVVRAFDDAVQAREGLSVQCRLLKRGETIWCSIKLAPMLDEGLVLGFVGTVEDVTERFELELQSEQSRIEAEKANQAKSAFLSRISHELRTPLHAMLGFAQLLLMEELSDKQKESVDNILGSGHHLLSLIRDVLDIARAESGELGVQIATVSLFPVVEESVQMLSALAREKAISVETKFDASDHVSVLADRQRLRQALINVLSNAIKFNRKEGTVAVSCTVRPDGYAVLTVRDTGSGIAADKVDRLFTPFDRLGAEGTEIEGTGLGLTLTKRLIDAMGGRLELRSDPRTGTEVEIELRCSGSRQPGFAVVEPVPGTPAGVVRKVLLIEDNDVNLRLMEQVFRGRPEFVLYSERTGKEGLEAARQIVPEIVLLDMNLPDIQGSSVIETLRADPALASLKIIVTSALADSRTVARASAAGADAYLTKPLHIGELMSTIEESMGVRR